MNDLCIQISNKRGDCKCTIEISNKCKCTKNLRKIKRYVVNRSIYIDYSRNKIKPNNVIL